ncbi:hypothetical protein niasHT_026966 [Heterodera trifolii]|uniref:Sema domain-containing protein n=1 Tax=Heterodera trifolii TaxID=157864 RepID=A0ABD2KRF4_9BILA
MVNPTMPSSSLPLFRRCFCFSIIFLSAALLALCPSTTTAQMWPSDQPTKEPRAFNLRDMDHPDAVAALELGLLHHYPPLSNASANHDDDSKQYFRLLELDGNHLLIGAADAVHNISLQTFERVSIYRWAPEEAEHKECTMKSMDQDLCRNFVRVLSRLSGGRLLICGTNAFAPKCRLLSPGGDTLSEFGAVGLAPFDPAQNGTYLMAQGDLLFTATVADFAGTDALIFRRNVSEPVETSDRSLLRTQRGNPLMLDRPQFVGSLQTDQYVYFFFHEEAAEAAAEFRPGAYSRVARVCKTDAGVPRRVAAAEWSTFVKARLNCSVPERSRPFYFDELVAISSSSDGGGAAGDVAPEDALIYATFVSDFNFLRHSVICAFRLRHVDELFRNAPYLAYDAVQRKWTRRERDLLTAGLGQCPKRGQKAMGDDEAIAARKYTLMADALPNAFPGGAVGIHRGDDHYSQIAVLPAVPHMDGGFVDVLYVATDHGNVLKMVNLMLISTITNTSSSSSGPSADHRPRHQNAVAASASVDDPLRLITALRLSREPIRRLFVSAPSPRFLVVVTDQRVHRVQLQLCDLYTTCTACVGARDPHCAWHHARCRPWQHIKSMDGEQPVQDVLGRKTVEELCRGKETTTAQTAAVPQTFKAMGTTKETNEKAGANRTTTKDRKKSCECAGPPLAHRCACAEADFLLDGISPTARGRQSAAAAPALSTKWPTLPPAGDMDAIAEAQALPWWVLLLLAIAMLQTIAFVWLCCRLRARRTRRRSLGAGGKKPFESGGVGSAPPNGCADSAPISAYSAASILISAGGIKQQQQQKQMHKATVVPTVSAAVGEQFQQHNIGGNGKNRNNNSSTTTSGQWTLTSGSDSAVSGSVSSGSNRSSAASSPVGGGQLSAGIGMCLGAPRATAAAATVLARRASYTGGYGRYRTPSCYNDAGGEISIRLDGMSSCGGNTMTLPPPGTTTMASPMVPVPSQHFARQQWPPAMSTFRR